MTLESQVKDWKDIKELGIEIGKERGFDAKGDLVKTWETKVREYCIKYDTKFNYSKQPE